MEPHWPSLLGPKFYEEKRLRSHQNKIIEELNIRTATYEDIRDIKFLDPDLFGFSSTNSILKGSLIVVAELYHNIVGVIVVNIVEDEMELLKIVVDPKYRRMGIGKSLLNRMLDIAEQKGLTVIYLDVSQKNLAAIALYQAFGFKEYGIRKDYYSKGEDAILMKLELSDQHREEQAA